jgi:hypothetical protein
MAIVYRHIRLDTNQPFYIGIGRTEKRAYEKKYRNNHWNSIVNKVDYKVEVLFDDLDWESACEKEKEFICLYGRQDTNTGILCNMTDGGEGGIGVVVSDEAKKKLSESKKGYKHSEEAKLKMSHYGKNRSEAHARKICESKRGKKHSEEHKRKIGEKSKGNQYRLGHNHSLETKLKISESLKGRVFSEETRIKMSNSFKGKFVSDETRLKLSELNKGKLLSEETKKKISKAIKGGLNPNAKIVLDLQTGIFYDCTKEAAITIGVTRRGLSRMLSGGSKNKTTMIYA